MILKDLLKYDDIVIQMHDNPDADTVGSGYAIYKYFQSYGKKVRLIYSGSYKITKSNMILMIKELDIPVEYVESIETPELLLTVDCQYGEGNVTGFGAKNVAIIDHHNTGRNSDAMCEIRSHLVSCATICYDMLLRAGFDINGDKSVATALYYGLYMDSNGFSEIRHPLERDMMEYLKIDHSIIKKLIHSNFSITELETAGIAMIRHNLDTIRRVSIIKANPCDPNILGIIGDMVLQVDTVDVSIVYNECPGGYKLSIRSCIDTVAANDMAAYISEGIGNGGGHDDKAGGYINENKFKERYCDVSIETYFFNRVQEYYDRFTIIYAKDGIADKAGFTLYKKRAYKCGYVHTTDIYHAGTEIRLRTLEGDVYVTCEDDVYLMIGTNGEIYPIEEQKFNRRYNRLDEAYCTEWNYPPTVYNTNSNETIGLTQYIRSCMSHEDSRIYAKKIEKAVKVFTKWNYERYMLGEIDDYICFSENDEYDIYVINKDIFSVAYEECRN